MQRMFMHKTGEERRRAQVRLNQVILDAYPKRKARKLIAMFERVEARLEYTPEEAAEAERRWLARYERSGERRAE